MKRPTRHLCRCIDCGMPFEVRGPEPIQFCGGCGYIRLMERLTDEERSLWNVPVRAA